MMRGRPFSPKSFWISYLVFALIAFVSGHLVMDVADVGVVHLVILLPIPFFCFGYFASRISFSILYALLVLVVAALFVFLIAPVVINTLRQ
jgi:hypothetical protein